jgi:hypothetical protein
MIRLLVRLPMFQLPELGAWIASPLHALARVSAQVLKPTRSCRDDQPECYRYSPQGHIAREMPSADFHRSIL